MHPNPEPFQILALDGGGYRGLFTAQVLADWESALGSSITEHFDLIVGTSTGGIIALGLALGMPATQLVDFYVQDGRRLFPSPSSTWRWTAGARHWLMAKYGSQCIENSLRSRFGNHVMADLTTPVVIPAFNLGTGKHWFFKTPHFDGNLLDHSRLVWEVARATSAAPTYFPGFKSPRGELFVDGGVLANNPSLVGYVEVQVNFGEYKDRVKILNIGTEGSECAIPHRRLRTGGLMAWAKCAPEVLMQAQSASVESLMPRLLGPECWMRINPEHGRSFAPMDLYTPDVFKGIGSSEAARRYPEAARLFFGHIARKGLVLKPTIKP